MRVITQVGRKYESNIDEPKRVADGHLLDPFIQVQNADSTVNTLFFKSKRTPENSTSSKSSASKPQRDTFDPSIRGSLRSYVPSPSVRDDETPELSKTYERSGKDHYYDEVPHSDHTPESQNPSSLLYSSQPDIYVKITSEPNSYSCEII